MANEVLMELFEYYDFYSLFFSFSSLNVRFDALLARCRASIDHDRVAPNAFIHFLARILEQINNDHIQSFHASNIHQMFILAHDDSLFHFSHIRSLRLCNIPSNIIHIIVERVYFYQLEHVSLDQKPLQLFPYSWYPSKHFLDSNRYPWLRSYSDSLMWLMEGTTVLSSLEHIRMDGASSSDSYLSLLRRSPRLKSFQANFWLESYKDSSSPIYTHDVLTNLHLRLGWKFHMSTIIYLFQSTPRVRKLTFTASKNRHYTVVDPHWWESVLSKYFLELKWLCLRLSSDTNHTPPNPDWPVDLNEHTVRQQIEASPYWHAHTWKLKYEKQMPTAERNYHWAAFSVS
ncbi:unnamed protein product [Rotaria sp. Silwood2]|nr:unnamed protein product [Rotaria sp. Silwood2]CAF3394957.1 unnamed protein product [Rotaria sp. Silwood2]CAF4474429.1 unnamed protein product [Rotaria sp. Silwood2]CAF4558689.1 unnamed protein product [Rotaria sp. Silwood2]